MTVMYYIQLETFLFKYGMVYNQPDDRTVKLTAMYWDKQYNSRGNIDYS